MYGLQIAIILAKLMVKSTKTEIRSIYTAGNANYTLWKL